MPWDKQFDQQEVLERAMDTFWNHGFEGTSVQMLVDSTGINRGSLYATFNGKRSLFLATLNRYLDRRARLLAELRRQANPRQAVRHVFERLLPCQGDTEVARGCFLVNTALDLAPHDAEVRDLVAQSQTEMEEFFVEQIIAGQSSGEFSAQLDPHKIASLLLAALLGTRVLARSRPDPELLHSVIETALKQLD